MNKLSYILISSILILVSVIGITVYLKNKSNSSVVITPERPSYTDFSISFPSSQGENIATVNFLKDKTVVPDAQNAGLYSLGNTFPADETDKTSPNYVITFEKETGFFNITLLKKPLINSQTEAEQYLKNFLKITESEMCNLSYTVSVPGYVDVDASGIDYRFSFCPGAVQF